MWEKNVLKGDHKVEISILMYTLFPTDAITVQSNTTSAKPLVTCSLLLSISHKQMQQKNVIIIM